MHKRADRIRNVALVGHRGSGKTSLHEALLFQAGAINRLGSVVEGTTVSDSDPDERARQMSIGATLSSFEWQDRRINLLDTPGDPSFVADALGALRVCESAVFVVNAVMGVEVSTTRLWRRAAELDLARLVFVNMLDRERADFFRTLDALRVFDVFFVMFGARPDMQPLAVYAQQYLVNFSDLGYGSAICVAIFALIAVFVAIYVRVFRVEE